MPDAAAGPQGAPIPKVIHQFAFQNGKPQRHEEQGGGGGGGGRGEMGIPISTQTWRGALTFHEFRVTLFLVAQEAGESVNHVVTQCSRGLENGSLRDVALNCRVHVQRSELQRLQQRGGCMGDADADADQEALLHRCAVSFPAPPPCSSSSS